MGAPLKKMQSIGKIYDLIEVEIYDISQERNLHDHMIKRGFFRLGLRLQCPHCIRHSWYPLQSIEDSFSCPRCLDTFNAVGNLDSAIWSYKTTGPFSVANYAEGAYAVLLTLDFFDERNLATMRMTPTTSFMAEAQDKRNLEADFAAFWQDSIFGEKKDGLLFGECKTYGKFKAKI